MRKILRELKREFPGVEIQVAGTNHYKLILANGYSVTVSGSPSRGNYLDNARSDMRRQMQKTQTKEGSTR